MVYLDSLKDLLFLEIASSIDGRQPLLELIGEYIDIAMMFL
jgi:hypothetical protein